MALEEPKTKRFKHSIISDRIYTSDFQNLFAKKWHDHDCLEDTDISLISQPFRVCKISNFIKNESFMDELKNELADVKSRRESIDLYQFEQTSDLGNIETTNIRCLWETFQNDIAAWLEKGMKIELSTKISMSSTCYFDTDYLLCHDDNMGDRRIAFILYLSKNWTVEDGGTLDLFDTDENGLPRTIVRSLVPEYNSLVFFEVLDNSYHQVAEVTSSDKSRWTISGWFHGSERISNRPPRPELEIHFARPDTENVVNLDTWITSSYLKSGIVTEIQEAVERKSYTLLSNFVKPEIYETLSRDVKSDTIVWNRVGPADVRNYEIAEMNSLPNILREFYRLFGSIEIFRLLKDYTELDLVPDEATNMNPKMSIELQRWSNGCYTLICDRPTDYEKIGRDERGQSLDTSVTTGTSNDSSAKNDLSLQSPRSTTLVGRRASTSSNDNEDIEDEEVLSHIQRDEVSRTAKKSTHMPSQQLASCSQLEDDNLSLKRTVPINPDSEDSEVSDIGDYLSDPFDASVECSEAEAEDEPETPESCISESRRGTLDVIMQFHTNKIGENDTIDYVDPQEQEGALIHVPAKDNHLCLVYKALGTNRLHKYVNHYCKGYFYNLVCTYYE